MAQLQQRVFLIFIRPCFVKPNVDETYPAIVTKYMGSLYRSPLGGELDGFLLPKKDSSTGINEYAYGYNPTSTGSSSPNLPLSKTPISLAIKLPELNLPKRDESASSSSAEKNKNENQTIGFGIERYDSTSGYKGRMPSTALVNSTPPINLNGWYSFDPWLLHSSWTSFEDCKTYVRYLVDLIGFSGILVANAINLELELLPNK